MSYQLVNPVPRTRSAGARERVRRSTCKLCGSGLYEAEPAVWLTQPMGLSHQDCAERYGASINGDHS